MYLHQINIFYVLLLVQLNLGTREEYFPDSTSDDTTSLKPEINRIISYLESNSDFIIALVYNKKTVKFLLTFEDQLLSIYS